MIDNSLRYLPDFSNDFVFPCPCVEVWIMTVRAAYIHIAMAMGREGPIKIKMSVFVYTFRVGLIHNASHFWTYVVKKG